MFFDQCINMHEHVTSVCPLENSGHPVRYYYKSQCLGSSHKVIVRLVLQPPLCGIGCRQILEMRRLLKILNLF